jgi:hypothetical protein
MRHEDRNLFVSPNPRLAGSMNGWGRLVLILVFACAMGLLEAICVIYLRRLILPEGVESGRPPARLGRHVELIREASTIVMLATAAWLAGTNVRSRLAAFFVMFGVWDILYYAGLKWLADWPGSWLEWDCLFLIPKPWYGPVLAPVLISAFFVFACGTHFLREESGRAIRFSLLPLALLTAGLCVWYGSFVKDTAAILAHGYKGVAYSWPLFAGGLALCAAGFGLALRRALSPRP